MAPYIKHLQLGCVWFHLAHLNSIMYTHEYKTFIQLATYIGNGNTITQICELQYS